MKEREIAIPVDSASIQLAKAIIANGGKIVSQRPDNSVVQIDLLTVPERFVSALSVGRYREIPVYERVNGGWQRVYEQ